MGLSLHILGVNQAMFMATAKRCFRGKAVHGKMAKGKVRTWETIRQSRMKNGGTSFTNGGEFQKKEDFEKECLLRFGIWSAWEEALAYAKEFDRIHSFLPETFSRWSADQGATSLRQNIRKTSKKRGQGSKPWALSI